MLDFTIPSGTVSANRKSPMRLNSSNEEINAVVKCFRNDTSNRYGQDGKSYQIDDAVLELSFPSLENDNNTFKFELHFPNRTVDAVAKEIFLYEKATDGTTIKKDSKLGKAILSICDEDGVQTYDSIATFRESFKLSGSTSKLYSILRENKSAFDLSKFASSLEGQTLKVQTYYHTQSKEYTIATTDYVAKHSSSFDLSKTTSRTPRSKRGGSIW